MSNEFFAPNSLRRRIISAVAGTVILAAGIIFTIQAGSNNNSVIQNLKTQDGRSIYTVTSSGSVTQSGTLVVTLPTFPNDAVGTIPNYPANQSYFDSFRFIGNNSGSFIDGFIENNATVNATTDFIAQNSAASQVAGYLDMGFTSQTYRVLNGAAQEVGPSQAYLYSPTSDISMGTEAATGALKFWVTSTNVSSTQVPIPMSAERMRITQSGAEIGTNTGVSRLILSGALLIGKDFGLKVAPPFPVGIDVHGTMSGNALSIRPSTATGYIKLGGKGTMCFNNTAGAAQVVTIVASTLTVRAAVAADNCPQ